MVETKLNQVALPNASAIKVAQHAKFIEVLDDLCMRFILNAPDEDFESVERLFFHIEEAYWFYADFICKKAKQEGNHLPNLSFAEFADSIFHHCPFLAPLRHAVEDFTKQFLHYKFKIPANGAIILNEHLDKVLLIRGYKANSWSFPKGKIHRNESDLHCAAREVKEEIGFDILPYANEKLFIAKNANGQTTKLFIVAGVPENTLFETQTRNEVDQICWHKVDSLGSCNAAVPRKTQLVQVFQKDIVDFCKQQLQIRFAQRQQFPQQQKQPQQQRRRSFEKQQGSPKQQQPRKKSPPHGNNNYRKQYPQQQLNNNNKFHQHNKNAGFGGSFTFDADEIVNAF